MKAFTEILSEYIDKANELMDKIYENPWKYRKPLIKIFGEDFKESLEDNENDTLTMSEIAGDFINSLCEKDPKMFIDVVNSLLNITDEKEEIEMPSVEYVKSQVKKIIEDDDKEDYFEIYLNNKVSLRVFESKRGLAITLRFRDITTGDIEDEGAWIGSIDNLTDNDLKKVEYKAKYINDNLAK